MIKFWKYNKGKVLLIGGISFGIPFVLLMIVGRRATAMAQTFELAAIIAVVAMVVYTIKGVVFFNTAESFINDVSDRSVIPLFDNGYTISTDNEDSKLFFTTEKLKGTIEGLPVTVSFPRLTRKAWPALTFNFYPLLQPGNELPQQRKKSYPLGITLRLTKDIKPDVLQFVMELKEQGYTGVKS